MDKLRAHMRDRWNKELASGDYDSIQAHSVTDPDEINRWRALFSQCPPGAKLLDIGTGTGYIALIAAECGLAVTAVDWSEPMMAHAREKANANGYKIRFILGETEDLPFDNEVFDVLASRHVIWTLADPPKTFREWFRVLKPGGTAYADYSPVPGGHHYSAEVEKNLPLNHDTNAATIKGMFRDAGFSQVLHDSFKQQISGGEPLHPSEVFIFTCVK